jgi:hypothetical protein
MKQLNNTVVSGDTNHGGNFINQAVLSIKI